MNVNDITKLSIGITIALVVVGLLLVRGLRGLRGRIVGVRRSRSARQREAQGDRHRAAERPPPGSSAHRHGFFFPFS